MKGSNSAVLCLASVLFAASALAQPSDDRSDRADAEELIRHAQRAVGQVVRLARSEARLENDSADAKPFWEAMKTLNESLSKAQTGLTLRDDTFHPELAASVAAVQQAEVALVMNEPGNAALDSAMSSLGSVVRALDETYGREAARLREGGELTAQEVKQLRQLKAQQAELAKKLEEVKKNVAANDERMKEGIRRIEDSSRRIRDASYSVSGFVGCMTASRFLSGWLWGWHWWWGPWGWWGPGFISINIDIWDVWIDTWDYDWALAELYVDAVDLGLDDFDLDLDDAELLLAEEWLEGGDFALDDADMMALTDDLAGGWDEVETEIGREIMDGFESNFIDDLYEPGFDIDVFDDFVFDDFGFDDFAGAFDW